jgi:hypothetical protein
MPVLAAGSAAKLPSVLDVVVAQSPDGPAEWLTAVGTLAVAAAAVWVALWSENRARKRLEDERCVARKREQLAEAYRVQVVLAEKQAAPPADYAEHARGPSGLSLVAIVVNHGAHTITGVKGEFHLSSGTDSLIFPAKTEWLSGFADLPNRLRAGVDGPPDFNLSLDRLHPWGAGIRFESDTMNAEQAFGAFPVISWADQWTTRWEYRQGQVRQIGPDATRAQ